MKVSEDENMKESKGELEEEKGQQLRVDNPDLNPNPTPNPNSNPNLGK